MDNKQSPNRTNRQSSIRPRLQKNIRKPRPTKLNPRKQIRIHASRPHIISRRRHNNKQNTPRNNRKPTSKKILRINKQTTQNLQALATGKNGSTVRQ